MDKKMFLLESLKLDKKLFDINGPFGIISSIFNIYTYTPKKHKIIFKDTSYLDDIFVLFDEFTKKDIAVIYITSNSIKDDYQIIINKINDDVLHCEILDNDTISIKLKNFHIHKKNIINCQKPSYMMTIFTLYHKYIYSDKTLIKSLLINDLTDIFILSDNLNITLNEMLFALVMYKIKHMDKSVYPKIMKHRDSKMIQSITPHIYDQLFDYHSNHNHSLLNKIAKHFVDVFNKEDYLKVLEYPFNINLNFYQKRQLKIPSFDEAFILIQAKDKNKLITFLKTIFENSYEKEIADKKNYYEIVLHTYEITKNYCYYIDEDISMAYIQSYAYGIHNHMIYKRRRGKKIGVIEYVEYYEEHKTKNIKEAFMYWFNFLAKDEISFEKEFYDSRLYSSILNQVIKRYYHERHHSHLFLSFEANFMGYIDELVKVGNDKIQRFYHLSYDLFKQIRKGDSI